MKLGEQQMNKKEWQEHSKWLDSFRGKIISGYNEYGEKKTNKKNIKKNKTKKGNQWLLF